jgi:hypothetical protein
MNENDNNNNNNEDYTDEIKFIKNSTKLKHNVFHLKNLNSNQNVRSIKDPLTVQKITKFYFCPYKDDIFKVNKMKNNKKFKVHDFKTDLNKKNFIPLCKIEKERKIEEEKKNKNNKKEIQNKIKNLFYVINNFPKIAIENKNKTFLYNKKSNLNFSIIKKKDLYSNCIENKNLTENKKKNKNSINFKNHLNYDENENKFKLINRNNIDIKNIYIIKKEIPPLERQNQKTNSNEKKRKINNYNNNNNNNYNNNILNKRPFSSYENYLLKFGIKENNIPINDNEKSLNNIILLGKPEIV